MELNWPLEPFGPVAEVHEAAGTEELLLGLIRGVEIAVTEMAPFTKRVIAAADALRLIVVCRGGPVNVNLAARRSAVSPSATPRLAMPLPQPSTPSGCSSRRCGGWPRDTRISPAASGAGTSTPIPRPGRSWTERRSDWSALVPLAPGCSCAAGVRGRSARRRSLCRSRAVVEAVGATAVAFGDLLPRAQDTESACATDAGDPPPDRPRADRPPPAELCWSTPHAAVSSIRMRFAMLWMRASCGPPRSTSTTRSRRRRVHASSRPPTSCSRRILAGASRETAERAAAIAAAEVGATCVANRCALLPTPRR